MGKMEGLRELLNKVRDGEVEISDALEELKFPPYRSLGHTKMDKHGKLQRGCPEAVFCEGKSREQLAEILKEFSDDQTAIATKASEKDYEHVRRSVDSAIYYEGVKIIQAGESIGGRGRAISVASAGTSDEGAAEECAVRAEIMGNVVRRIYGVGISGVNGLLSYPGRLRESSVTFGVPGMEGALPGPISGLVSAPVTGVPTSLGYGSHLKGIAHLPSTLNVCSPGLSVVNVGDGYGSTYLATLVNRG